MPNYFTSLIALVTGLAIFHASSALAAPTNVCERTSEVREAIESAVGVRCAQVTPAQLMRVRELVITLESESLKDIDFQGLTNLIEVDVDGPFESIPETLFRDTGKLASLIITARKLTTLPPGLFRGLRSLRLLDVNTAAQVLPENLFADLKNLRSLELYLPALEVLPGAIFQPVPSLTKIDLGTGKAPVPASLFSGLQDLTELIFSSGDPGAAPSGLFRGLASLEILYTDLAFSSVPQDLLSDLVSLRDLAFSSPTLRVRRVRSFTSTLASAVLK